MKLSKLIGKKGDLMEAMEPLIVPIAVIVAIIVITIIVFTILKLLK